ncbi:MAG: hypothetical protein LW850_03815, partial [Planctomycetaceae bacterium]|nr:hypothetical protein [Planctomycetaceae bacterium]
MNSQASMQRREFLAGAIAGGISLASGPKWIGKAQGSGLSVSDRNPKWESATRRGLDFLARTQSSRGQWNTPPYPVAVTALAGLALLCS